MDRSSPQPDPARWEHWSRLEALLNDVVSHLALLPPNYTVLTREFIDAREYGLAYDTLCDAIVEHKIPVPQDTLNVLAELRELMALEDPDPLAALQEPSTGPPVRGGEDR